MLPAVPANMSPDRRVAIREYTSYNATQLPLPGPHPYTPPIRRRDPATGKVTFELPDPIPYTLPITRWNPTNDNVNFDISPNAEGGVTISGNAADTARVLQHYVAGLDPGRRGMVTEIPTAPTAERNPIVTVNFTTCLCCENRFDTKKTKVYSM